MTSSDDTHAAGAFTPRSAVSQPAKRLGAVNSGLNILFGTLGQVLLREIGSSSFHAGHHRAPTNHFGFYTLIGDRLFGTLERPNPPSFRP